LNLVIHYIHIYLIPVLILYYY